MAYAKKQKHTLYRGGGMDKQADSANDAMHELEQEIMLHISERLFKSGGITAEMYDGAKELILKV